MRRTLSALRSGTKAGPTRSVGTREAMDRNAFLQRTSGTPRSGTNAAPTRSVGTREAMGRTRSAADVEHAAERHQGRAHAERGYEGFVVHDGLDQNRKLKNPVFTRDSTGE